MNTFQFLYIVGFSFFIGALTSRFWATKTDLPRSLRMIAISITTIAGYLFQTTIIELYIDVVSIRIAEAHFSGAVGFLTGFLIWTFMAVPPDQPTPTEEAQPES